MLSIFMFAVYTQVNFRLDFVMEENTMDPDQTAPSGSILIAISAT